MLCTRRKKKFGGMRSRVSRKQWRDVALCFKEWIFVKKYKKNFKENERSVELFESNNCQSRSPMMRLYLLYSKNLMIVKAIKTNSWGNIDGIEKQGKKEESKERK